MANDPLLRVFLPHSELYARRYGLPAPGVFLFDMSLELLLAMIVVVAIAGPLLDRWLK